MVTEAVAKRELSQQVQDMADQWQGYYCFEEDCAWALAAKELTAVRDHALKQEGQTAERFDAAVLGTLARWYPEFLEQTGEPYSDETYEEVEKPRNSRMATDAQVREAMQQCSDPIHFTVRYDEEAGTLTIKANGHKIYAGEPHVPLQEDGQFNERILLEAKLYHDLTRKARKFLGMEGKVPETRSR